MWIILWSVSELALQLPTLSCKLGVFISTKKCRPQSLPFRKKQNTCDFWPPKNAESWNSMDFFVETFWWCDLSCLLVNHHRVHVRQNMLFPSHPPKREHASQRPNPAEGRFTLDLTPPIISVQAISSATENTWLCWWKGDGNGRSWFLKNGGKMPGV